MSAPLDRCDPAVLLVATVTVPVLLVPVTRPGPVVALWLVACVAVLATSRAGVRRLAVGHLPFLGFAVGVLTVNAVTRDGAVVAHVGPLEVTDVGLATGAAFAVRTLVVGVGAIAFLVTVDPGRLLSSAHQVLRVPVRFAVALMVAHRVVQDLPAEWASVRQAHALRAPGPPDLRPVRDGLAVLRLPTGPGDLARASFTLLAGAIRRADRMSVALEARALGALPRGERTVWRPAAVGVRDGVLLVAVVGACALTAALAR